MSTKQDEVMRALAEAEARESQRSLQRVNKMSNGSEAPSEAKTTILSVDFDPDKVSRGSPEESGGSPNRESILKGSGQHESTKRVTVVSGTSETGSPPHDQDHSRASHDSKSFLMRKKSSRKATLSYDIVVDEEQDPEFVADLHDLTKEKLEAHDLLVTEASLEVHREKGDDTKKTYVAPWRQHGKSASKAKLLDEKMGDQKRFGVKIRDKLWVPNIVNHLEIDLRKSQKKELKEVFELIENPRAGLVCIDDIAAVVKACGSEPTPALVEDILKKIEPHHPGEYHTCIVEYIYSAANLTCINTGYLTGEEFEEILRYRLQEPDPIEEIERAFKMMTGGRKERINLEDLREVSKVVEYPLTDDELMEMINAAGPTGSGTQKGATLGGFVRLMTAPNWYDTGKPIKRKKGKMSTLKSERVYRKVSPAPGPTGPPGLTGPPTPPVLDQSLAGAVRSNSTIRPID